MTIIDGKQTAEEYKSILKQEVKALVATGKRPPGLAILLIGNNGASETYVANIDFGSDDKYINRHGKKCKGTAREHYHALVYSSHIDYKPWKDKYGFIDFEHVRPFENDSKAISRYITKLSRHALKSSTSKDGNSPRLIYSRKVVKLPPSWLFDD